MVKSACGCVDKSIKHVWASYLNSPSYLRSLCREWEGHSIWSDYIVSEGSDTPTKSVRDFEISGFHGRFRDFSEDFEISLEISRFQLRFRDFS